MEQAGLTQKELAAATGLAQSTVSHYMRGARSAPRVEEVLALATYFKVSIEWLLGADAPPPAERPDPARDELDRRNAELRTVITNIEEQLTRLRALASPPKRARLKPPAPDADS